MLGTVPCPEPPAVAYGTLSKGHGALHPTHPRMPKAPRGLALRVRAALYYTVGNVSVSRGGWEQKLHVHAYCTWEGVSLAHEAATLVNPTYAMQTNRLC